MKYLYLLLFPLLLASCEQDTANRLEREQVNRSQEGWCVTSPHPHSTGASNVT